ncbi:MAG TPA: sortase [Streptosporangiaceae bacterium]|nr:sortase [Streptosporangiaceae bacterium]
MPPAAVSAAAIRSLAARWITEQVSPGAIVACDPAMAATLEANGLSAGDTLVLTPRSGCRDMMKSSGRPAAAAVLVCGLLVTGTGICGLLLASWTGRGPVAVGPAAPVPVPHGYAGALGAAPSGRVAEPDELIIPVIGVRTEIIRLGATHAGALQVPATAAVAGRYTESPPPGAIGSSVIVGHVDSLRGPGVFFRLRLLRARDLLYVRRADGTLAVFSVDAVQMYAKDHFPATLVYGPTPDAELRLITCGGTFDPRLGSYLSNAVVYAAGVR